MEHAGLILVFAVVNPNGTLKEKLTREQLLAMGGNKKWNLRFQHAR